MAVIVSIVMIRVAAIMTSLIAIHVYSCGHSSCNHNDRDRSHAGHDSNQNSVALVEKHSRHLGV